jgi:hypothetical protein
VSYLRRVLKALNEFFVGPAEYICGACGKLFVGPSNDATFCGCLDHRERSVPASQSYAGGNQ